MPFPPFLALLVAGPPLIADVAYGPDAKQRVDVFVPAPSAGRGSLPIAVFFHGGVWQVGDKGDVQNVGRALADAGIVTVVASYRLAPAHRWPAQIEDAASVVALARTRAAEWGADPKQLTLVGHSAGAHLAMLLALDASWGARAASPFTPDDIAAIVAISGVFDLRAALDEGQPDGGRARFITPVFGADPDLLARASPITRLDRAKALPELLFIVGAQDYAAMRAQTAAFIKVLPGAAVVTVPERDHFGLVTKIGSRVDRTTTEILNVARSTGGARRSSPARPADR